MSPINVLWYYLYAEDPVVLICPVLYPSAYTEKLLISQQSTSESLKLKEQSIPSILVMSLFKHHSPSYIVYDQDE